MASLSARETLDALRSSICVAANAAGLGEFIEEASLAINIRQFVFDSGVVTVRLGRNPRRLDTTTTITREDQS